MARMTKKLVREIWSWTTQCFKETLVELYPTELKDMDLALSTDKDLLAELRYNHLINPNADPRTNKLYLEKVKKLDSHKLSLIIESNKKGKIIRSPVTIHALMDELFERSVQKETSE